MSEVPPLASPPREDKYVLARSTPTLYNTLQEIGNPCFKSAWPERSKHSNAGGW